jgi:hypothetical protein
MSAFSIQDSEFIVSPYLGDTTDHVLDVSADSADAGNVEASAVVDDNAKLLLGDEFHLTLDVLELLAELAAGALDEHLTGLDRDGHYSSEGEKGERGGKWVHVSTLEPH